MIKEIINLFLQSIGEKPIDWRKDYAKAYAYGVVDRLLEEGRIDEDAALRLRELICRIP